MHRPRCQAYLYCASTGCKSNMASTSMGICHLQSHLQTHTMGYLSLEDRVHVSSKSGRRVKLVFLPRPPPYHDVWSDPMSHPYSPSPLGTSDHHPKPSPPAQNPPDPRDLSFLTTTHHPEYLAASQQRFRPAFQLPSTPEDSPQRPLSVSHY